MKIAKKLAIALRKALSLEFGSVNTDKNTLLFDGELAVGTEVFVEDENAELIPAEDGEYLAEDGRTIVVANGVVTEIREKEPENEPENVEEPVEAEEIEDPAEEPADSADEEAEEESVEDKVNRLEGLVNGLADGIEKIINAIAAIEARLDDVEAKIAKLDSEEAAEPAEEQVVEEEQAPKNRLAYLRKN